MASKRRIRVIFYAEGQDQSVPGLFNITPRIFSKYRWFVWKYPTPWLLDVEVAWNFCDGDYINILFRANKLWIYGKSLSYCNTKRLEWLHKIVRKSRPPILILSE